MRKKETGSWEFIWGEAKNWSTFACLTPCGCWCDGSSAGNNGVGRAPRPETPVRDIKTASRQDETGHPILPTPHGIRRRKMKQNVLQIPVLGRPVGRR